MLEIVLLTDDDELGLIEIALTAGAVPAELVQTGG
jgi:hypothetical protein